MVGVARSRGCLLCVKRRVKCDEARPGCGNCFKYGRDCPGYDRSLKFVAGKHQVRSRRTKAEREGQLEFSVAIRSPAASGTSATDSHGIQGSDDIPSSGSRRSSVRGRSPPMTVTPSPNRALFICTVIEKLRLDQPRAELAVFGVWFGQLMEQVGNKITIDSAMCAFVLHLLGKTQKDPRVIAESRQIYGQSLTALQRALHHPEEWKATETLSASIVLCMYEVSSPYSCHAHSWPRL
jgi:hypothetical protein